VEASTLSGAPIKDEDTAVTPETLVPFEDNKESMAPFEDNKESMAPFEDNKESSMSEINLEPIQQQLQELDDESDKVSISSTLYARIFCTNVVFLVMFWLC